MIAPAMGAPTFPHFQVSEAVRRGTRIRRECDESEFTRLAGATCEVEKVEVDVSFAKATDGLPMLKGLATASVRLDCHRCEETVARTLRADFDLCLVDEERAASIETTRDICVVSRDRINLLDIVEDELLLSLPTRVCVDAHCENAPALAYPADEMTGEEREGLGAKTKPNPFAVLQQLRTSSDETQPDD